MNIYSHYIGICTNFNCHIELWKSNLPFWEALACSRQQFTRKMVNFLSCRFFNTVKVIWRISRFTGEEGASGAPTCIISGTSGHASARNNGNNARRSCRYNSSSYFNAWVSKYLYIQSVHCHYFNVDCTSLIAKTKMKCNKVRVHESSGSAFDCRSRGSLLESYTGLTWIFQGTRNESPRLHSTKMWTGTLRGLCLCKLDIIGRRMLAALLGGLVTTFICFKTLLAAIYNDTCIWHHIKYLKYTNNIPA